MNFIKHQYDFIMLKSYEKSIYSKTKYEFSNLTIMTDSFYFYHLIRLAILYISRSVFIWREFNLNESL